MRYFKYTSESGIGVIEAPDIANAIFRLLTKNRRLIVKHPTITEINKEEFDALFKGGQI